MFTTSIRVSSRAAHGTEEYVKKLLSLASFKIEPTTSGALRQNVLYGAPERITS